jgi:hypothetical protein
MFKLRSGKGVIFVGGLLIILSFSLFLAGCKITFNASGANICATCKTFSVSYFQNRAAIINPTLSQTITEKLKDKILSSTSLDIVKTNGQLMFEGQITNYEARPANLQSNDKPAQNRLTITLKVKFTNSEEPKWNYDTNFSQYVDFSANQDLKSVEGSLVPDLIDKLIDDIFNKALANW